MGNQKQGFCLVIMTNKDVYYVSGDAADYLAECIQHGQPQLFQTTDVKSGAKLRLQISQVSSLVEDTRNV